VALYKISYDFSREKNIQPSSSDQNLEREEGVIEFFGRFREKVYNAELFWGESCDLDIRNIQNNKISKFIASK